MISILLILSTIIISVFFYLEFNDLKSKFVRYTPNKEKGIKTWNKRFLITLSCILFITIWALYMLIVSGNSYNNTDHMVLNREGIRFSKPLLFSSSTKPYNSYTGSSESTIELLPNRQNTCVIRASHLCNPLMVSNDSGNLFHFVNPESAVPITSSFGIISNDYRDTLFYINESGLHNLQHKKSKKLYKRILGFEEDRLKKFIDLSDVSSARKDLRKLPILNGSCFVYSSIEPTDNKIDTARLLFFCGPLLRQMSGDYFLLLNGKHIDLNPGFTSIESTLKTADEFFLLEDEKSVYRRSKVFPDSTGIFLKYTNPIRRSFREGHLGQELTQTMTNVEDTLIDPKYDNVIYQEPLFPGMRYVYTASITYRVDKGNENLKLLRTTNFTSYNAPATQKGIRYFVANSNPDYGIVFSIQDLTQSNGFGFVKHILLPLLFFILIITGILLYLNKYKLKNFNDAQKYYNPVFQSIIFIIPLFFAIRWFLAWRYSAFPPIDNNMTKSEWDVITGYFALNHIIKDYIFFFGFTFVIAVFSFPLIPLDKFKILIQENKRLKFILLSLLLFAVIITFSLSARFSHIFSPLLIIGIVFIYTRNNHGLLTFNLLVQIRRWMGPMIYYLLVISVVFLFSLSLFFIFNPDKGFGILYGIALLLSLITFMLDSLPLKKVILKFALAFVILISGFWGYTYLKNNVERFTSDNQTIARAKVITEDVTHIFQHSMNDTLYNKTIETLQYRDYINAYMHFGAGWHPSHFLGFDLQPHFAPDRNYDIQTYDTIGARYIYAEHGKIAYWMLLLLLSVPLVIRSLHTFESISSNMYEEKEKPWSQSVFIKNFFQNFDLFCLLMIFIVGLIIGLSNTNNFIFLGQDMPIVAFGSIVSLGYILMLFFFVTLTKSSHANYIKLSESHFNPFNTPAGRRISIFTTVFALFVLLLIIDASGYRNKQASANFDLEDHLKDIQSDIDSYNDRIYTFQTDALNRTHDSLGKPLSEYTPDDQLVQIICQHLDELKAGNIASPLNDFVYSRVERMLQNRSRWFNYKELIFLIHRDGILQLKLNTNYYYRAYPMAKDSSWMGNLIARSGKDTLFLAVNKWVNGGNRHVYPYKGKYGWVYDMVQEIKRSSTENGYPKKDSNFVLSIDFALQQEIAGLIMERGLTDKSDPDALIRLTAFRDLPLQMKRDSNNYTSIWFKIDTTSAIVIDKDRLVEDTIIKEINKSLNNSTQKQILRNHEFYKLDIQIAEIINDVYYSFNPPIYVASADALGKIRLLLDYNSIPGFDPNSVRLSGFFEEVNNNMNSYQIEEKMRRNGCTTTLKPGPGSSLKPIIYSSVMSQYKLDWAKLKVKNTFERAVEEENIRYYAGKKLQNNMKWKVSLFDTHDFSSNINMIGPIEYLANSSNLYHSSILFLGHYTRNDIQNLSSILTGRENAEDKFNFPVIEYKNKNCYFRSENWPTFTDTSSLVCKGLRSNYGFLVSKYLNPYSSRQKFIVDIESVNKKVLSKVELFSKRIAHTTAGGEPIETTALDMAFNGLRLFTLSSNADNGLYSFSNEIDRPWQKYHFSYDNSYPNEKDFIETIRANIYAPMNSIFRNGTFTSSDLAKSMLQLETSGSGTYKLNKQDIFIYAKTGTTYEEGGPFTNGDKALLFIFTNHDMTDVTSYAQLDEIKVYSVYIHQKNAYNTKKQEKINTLRVNVIRLITESSEFKNYFEIK